MAKRAVPELSEALELIASLEAQCEELRSTAAGDNQGIPDELRALLAEIRDRISPIVD
ncbi:MAG: hypothetical protein ACJ8EY_01360 [Sphingomicrobium sp.]